MKVALIFGGRSPESDISVITGLTAAAALSETGYEVTPVYMHGGDFYTGGLGKVEEFTVSLSSGGTGCAGSGVRMSRSYAVTAEKGRTAPSRRCSNTTACPIARRVSRVRR